MLTSALGTLRFSWSLFFDVIKRPAKVVADLPTMSLGQCLFFGWACLFLSSTITALIQSAASGYVLSQITDPQMFAEMTKYSGTLFNGSVDEFKANLITFRAVNFVNLMLSPLTAWFFPYLISGALFILLNLVSLQKSGSERYEEVMKIVAVGQAPLIFCVIPFVGSFIGNIWCLFFVVRALGSVFQVHFLGRLSATGLCFLSLFTIWNSTVALLAAALQRGDWKWVL